MPVTKRFLTGLLDVGVFLGGAAGAGTDAAAQRRAPLRTMPDAAYAPGAEVRGRAVADLPAARLELRPKSP
jgi:hypothetical protein